MKTMSLFPVDLIRVKILIIKTGQGKIMIGIKKKSNKLKYEHVAEWGQILNSYLSISIY